MDRPIHNQTLFGPVEAGDDPFVLFNCWFNEALSADPNNTAVAALATASKNARPSLRMVLLKDYGPAGFLFYTNHHSRKAAELTENPHAALTFWWHSFAKASEGRPVPERQVRIEGSVEKISDEESDAYFATRPRESRLSAWASPQSRAINEPVSLTQVHAQFEGMDVPRPEDWGGFRIIPDTFEFWQGRDNRLHDRIRFSLFSKHWKIERLAP